MFSIPSTYENPQPSYQKLTVQLSTARKRAAILEEENKNLRQKLKWREQLDRVSNTVLSTGERTTLRVTMQQISDKEPDENGYYLLDLWKIGKGSGQSDATVGKHLKQCAERARLFDRQERKVPDSNTETGFRTEVRVRPDLPLIASPLRYTAAKERNHGGDRKACPSCRSKRIRKKTTYTCMDCGTIFDEKITDYEETEPHTQNQVDFSNNTPLDTPPPHKINLITIKTKEEPGIKLISDLQKPSTPPKPAPAMLSGKEIKEHGHPPNPCQTRLREEAENKRREQTVRLMLDIAGDTNEHIIMPGHALRQAGGNGKKYTTIHRALNTRDIEAHLTGTKTVGATLHHRDGATRALCFDTDDNPTDSVCFQQLQDTAPLLVAKGYIPLFEPSPAGRGGHLWLIFSERVNAVAAYRQVCETAPVLKDIVEYWPGRGNQKVRLPGGKYVASTFSKWTHIIDATGREVKTRDLIDYQTPAHLIPDKLPDDSEPESNTRRRAMPYGRQTPIPDRSMTPDETHREKYRDQRMWVEWPDETYLIDRFNREHTIDGLAGRKHRGLINAGEIGREERTASVAVTPDGQRFTDFGAGAKLSDGSQDGGDPFEFYIRSRHLSKSRALRELGQALNKEASTEILRAARAGELPSSWVMDILTDKGLKVYNQNALKYGHKTLEEHRGGTAGFSKSAGDKMQEQERQDCEQRIPEDFTKATPCDRCGCALYRNMAEHVVCVRCYPARGYHLYADWIEEQYPRKSYLKFS